MLVKGIFRETKMIPFIDLQAQYDSVSENIDSSISKVLKHGKYILGPEVDQLESDLIDFTGSTNCITCANGTDALQIALMALDVGSGDEIITAGFGYIAGAETIKLLNANIVYVDISPLDYNIEPDLLEKAITDKTKAIIVISLYGQPANFEKINDIADKFQIPVIEDAAQSFGASYQNRRSCNLSTIACTSFFPAKPLGCYGDGGAIFTSDNELAYKIRQIARHGQDGRYNHVRVGVNSRLDTIQAAILIEKLKILDSEIRERDKLAKYYDEALSSIGAVLPVILPGRSSAWAQYTIRVKSRDQIRAMLLDLGIPTAVHYPQSLNNQPAVSDLDCSVPESESAAKEVLSLPMHAYMSAADREKIKSALSQLNGIKTQ